MSFSRFARKPAPAASRDTVRTALAEVRAIYADLDNRPASSAPARASRSAASSSARASCPASRAAKPLLAAHALRATGRKTPADLRQRRVPHARRPDRQMPHLRGPPLRLPHAFLPRRRWTPTPAATCSTSSAVWKPSTPPSASTTAPSLSSPPLSLPLLEGLDSHPLRHVPFGSTFVRASAVHRVPVVDYPPVPIRLTRASPLCSRPW